RLGLLRRKESIQSILAASSHRAKAPSSKSTWVIWTSLVSRLLRRRYVSRSEESRSGTELQLLPNGVKVLGEQGMLPPLHGRKTPQRREVVDGLHPAGAGGEHHHMVGHADALGDVVGDQDGGLALLADHGVDVVGD